MDAIIQGAGLVLNPPVLLVIFLSALFGLFVGSIPGLTATMATALLVPVTFFMAPVPAIGAIVTATAMAIFAGDIPGALLRIPGTPASAAYAEEAYLMTGKGQADMCLGTNLTFSTMGGLFGTTVLVVFATILAEVALEFSSYEYFWLACLGLSCAVFVSPASQLKGVVSLLIGLFISTIGLDITTGYPRFTFGVTELMGGVSFIPAMIGLFAVSEVLRNMAAVGPPETVPQQPVRHLFHGFGARFRRYWPNFLRGSILGTGIGALPGAGADIAAWISYAVSKKFSRDKDKYGTGHIEGIIDATSSNNAGLSGAWVPALVFGIPGDSITAIVIGVLYMKGLNPGPTVFIRQPQLIYGVFTTFFLANLLLLPLGFLAIKSAKQMMRVPRNMLMPIILMFCIVGSFAINNTVFSVGLMLVIGLLAYVMEENGFPVAPTILGIVLGPILEGNFMTSMIKSNGDLLAFFHRPIAAGLGVVTVALWLSPLWLPLLRRLWNGMRRRASTST